MLLPETGLMVWYNVLFLQCHDKQFLEATTGSKLFVLYDITFTRFAIRMICAIFHCRGNIQFVKCSWSLRLVTLELFWQCFVASLYLDWFQVLSLVEFAFDDILYFCWGNSFNLGVGVGKSSYLRCFIFFFLWYSFGGVGKLWRNVWMLPLPLLISMAILIGVR